MYYVMSFLWMHVTCYLIGLGCLIIMWFMMGTPINMYSNTRIAILLWHDYPHLNPLNLSWGKKRLFMTETRVERGTRKSNPLFAVLMVESNIWDGVRPLHSLAQLLLRKFKNVFPMIYPQGFLHWEKLSSKLIFYRVILWQTSWPICAILMSKKSFNNKSKSYLTMGTLGEA